MGNEFVIKLASIFCVVLYLYYYSYTYLTTYSLWSAIHELSLWLNYQVYRWQRTSLLLQLSELQLVFRNNIFWNYSIIMKMWSLNLCWDIFSSHPHWDICKLTWLNLCLVCRKSSCNKIIKMYWIYVMVM